MSYNSHQFPKSNRTMIYDTTSGDLLTAKGARIFRFEQHKAFGLLFNRPAIAARGNLRDPTSFRTIVPPSDWPDPLPPQGPDDRTKLEAFSRYYLDARGGLTKPHHTHTPRVKDGVLLNGVPITGRWVRVNGVRLRPETIIAALMHDSPSLIGDPRVIFHPTQGHIILPPSGWHPVETDHGWKPVHLPFI